VIPSRSPVRLSLDQAVSRIRSVISAACPLWLPAGASPPDASFPRSCPFLRPSSFETMNRSRRTELYRFSFVPPSALAFPILSFHSAERMMNTHPSPRCEEGSPHETSFVSAILSLLPFPQLLLFVFCLSRSFFLGSFASPSYIEKEGLSFPVQRVLVLPSFLFLSVCFSNEPLSPAIPLVLKRDAPKS